MLEGFISKMDKVMCPQKMSICQHQNWTVNDSTVKLFHDSKYSKLNSTEICSQWVKKKCKVFRTMELCWEACGTCFRTWNPLSEWKNALSWDQQIPCPGLVSDCEKKSQPVIIWFYFAQFCSPLLPSRDQPCQNSGIEYFYKEIKAIKIVTTGMNSLVGNDSS